MSKNTASEKRLKTTEQSGNVTTTAIGDRFKKIQETPKQSYVKRCSRVVFSYKQRETDLTNRHESLPPPPYPPSPSVPPNDV